MKYNLQIKNYSPKTIKTYIRYVQEFSAYFEKSPTELGDEDIRAFLHYLATEKQVSASYIKNAYSALKFLYQKTLYRDWNTITLPRSKVPKKLPVILSPSEVQNLLNQAPNLKYKAILTTTYGAGLRVSEVVNLKIKDIDSANMLIKVRQAKGIKDRYTLLSKINLKILREYWKTYRPQEWLFPGRYPDKPISVRSVQRTFKSAREKAGIKKEATVHTLRHCFATHLLESGIDIYHIQQLMGHSSPKTTSIYIHLTRRHILNVRSPLDLIGYVYND